METAIEDYIEQRKPKITKIVRKWTIVGFNHPDHRKSIIYKQNILHNTLIRALEEGIERGCNIFSIRGFQEAIKHD